MKQVGEVVRADIIEDYDGKSKVTCHQLTSHSSQGCGLVEFADEETALRAMRELNDTMICDRPIFIREDREGPQTFRGGRRGPNRDWKQSG
ncbi:RNA recognition motif-containing protein [Babesia ovata]|uniref:RNA recognition motif-containing protein n=1 Tax=Babesia ovata TaxID=189622 RepID=A0A2H6KH03_9APIC|nr:RNA recognition motif-containing protein [Babesia ovata]GBE62272.1 RNA recognition motif-containing protein [Babesia ovata]